ncbi:unnamed protein product [Enterobius vermicularis]|uniref:Ovate family protein n=1 Tax=Enterobius vermicularis TaxID=51028 RepID=A0A0N4VCT3_ENTVE|nr:unnamed protein product [Enterobius vermicularis]
MGLFKNKKKKQPSDFSIFVEQNLRTKGTDQSTSSDRRYVNLEKDQGERGSSPKVNAANVYPELTTAASLTVSSFDSEHEEIVGNQQYENFTISSLVREFADVNVTKNQEVYQIPSMARQCCKTAIVLFILALIAGFILVGIFMDNG